MLLAMVCESTDVLRIISLLTNEFLKAKEEKLLSKTTG